MRRIFRQPLYPIFFALFPVLVLFNDNFDELFLENLVRPALQVTSALLVSWLIVSFFLKSKQKSALIVSAFFFLALSYGRFLNNTEVLQFNEALMPKNLVNNQFFITGIILLLLISILLIHKVKSNFEFLTLFLNIISVSLIVIPFTAITYKQIIRSSHNPYLPETLKFVLTSKKNISNLPDIYYLIVDRYPNNKNLKNYYEFDNANFTSFLANRGFYIASDSAANYPATHSSLSSSLNMEYLDALIKKMGPDYYDKTPFYNQIENNRIIMFLKSSGYKYFHFGSRWNPTIKNENADFNYQYISKPPDKTRADLRSLKEENNLLTIFLNKTLGETIANELSKEEDYWQISIDQMIKLSKTVKTEGPKFVFMHSLITHPPYVFNRDGQKLPEPLEGTGLRREYTEQLIFANKMLEKLIETILQDSTTPPIIILQSDEGPYPEAYFSMGGGFNWHKATADELKEKMGILNAYYFPGVKTDMLYPSISPVNSFRVLFNLYFNQSFPLLPDKSYMFVFRGRPYNLFEITDIVK